MLHICVPSRNGYKGWAFRGRGATLDRSGSECLEVEEVMLDRKISKKLKGKFLRACYTGLPVWSGDSVIDSTTTEAASL